jgi:hypothetical protein
MSDVGPWRSLIEDLTEDAKFSPGASEGQISQAEKAIGIPLPEHLRSLLLESDGVRADYGFEVIWSCTELVERNLQFRRYEPFRELYMPFDNLLFIGRDCGGDQFAFSIMANGEITKHDIYRWDHETDGRVWFSGRLRQYLEFCLSPSYDDC